MNCPPPVNRIFLLAGQSNAAGSSGRFGNTDFGMQLTGLNVDYLTPNNAVLFAQKLVNRPDSSTAYETLLPGPLQRRVDNGRFGVEISLARLVNGIRPSHWGARDKVVFLKYASPGSNIDHWLPGHETGNQEVFFDWLASTLSQLQGNYTFENLFWIQGEADTSPFRSPDYVLKFDAFLQDLNAIGNFTPVFSSIKGRGDGVNLQGATDINQAMASAGYKVTVDNNDLDFLVEPVSIHFTADSTIELSKRLFNASL